MVTEQRDLHVPSGFEVESASLHMPASAGEVPQAESRSWKEKVVAFPRERIAQARPKVKQLQSTVKQSLHGKPALWAGIAAGAGLALGIAGRMARHRMSAKKLPTLVIIEGM